MPAKAGIEVKKGPQWRAGRQLRRMSIERTRGHINMLLDRKAQVDYTGNGQATYGASYRKEEAERLATLLLVDSLR